MIKKNPLVSICIPAYNAKEWIRYTLKSAINQTWCNKEIIVVDDGSIDNTLIIAKEFESDFVKVISQNNKGASAARNHALSLAKGDFIQWLDADDLLAPDKIEAQLTACDYNPDTKTLISSKFTRFYFHPHRAKFIPNQLWQDLTPLEWLSINMREDVLMFPHVWLVSRKLTESAGIWDERLTLNDDGEYFSRVVAASEFVMFVDNAKCYYRTGNITSLSNTKSTKALQSLSLSHNLCVDHMLSLRNNENTRETCIIYLQKLVSNILYDEYGIFESNRKRIIELGGTIIPKNESVKFKIARKLLGLKIASNLKILFWNIHIAISKYKYRIFSYFFHREV